MKKALAIIIMFLFFAGCQKSPNISADILGGGQVFDPSLYNPQNFLVSLSNPNPTAEEAQKPVIIACHGYSATTFEWDEFNDWSQDQSKYSISRVLLAGHGSTYADFEKSTWHDWQLSIADEYNKLIEEGYKNIDFAASSTSCTLLLDMIHSGFFNHANTTVHIFLIDPIIIPSDKSLSLIGVFGPMLGYLKADNTTAENKYYYLFRPQETLQQLEQVLNTVRHELEDGIVLPNNVYLKVYKSKQDPTADPVSAVLIYNGVKTGNGNRIDIQLEDSKLHVFTRLRLRPNVTAQDKANQLNAFTDIATRIFN
ncbi:MAG: esterase/lipase-like protein [Mucilaginibacter sp.]|nr:esterase/lipase-like protein [Mucilaginibacter sp.]